MRRPARNGQAHLEVTGRENVLRDPMPTARAILWKPLPDSYHLLASMMRTTEQQAFLFITQRAFLQVERHLASAPELELGGFLAGQLFECPRMHVRYSIINTVVPFADVSRDALLSRVTQESFEAVRKRLDAHRLSLLGWYRNGNGLGLQLLPDDVETHLTYFDQPWQTTMLVLPDPAKPKGAFFTHDSRVGRSYCVPFYELFDSPSVDATRQDRTCVSWATYVAAEPVTPLPAAEKEVVEATVAPPRKPTPEAEPREPIDEWWDAIKDPWVRLKEVAVSATRREDNVSLVSRAAPDEPPLQPLKVETPQKVELPRILTTPVREQHQLGERTPTASPVVNAEPRPTRARSAPAQGARPLQPPFPRPAPPRRDDSPRSSAAWPAKPAEAPQKRSAPPPAKPMAASNGPAVALPPDFHEEARRWQRRRRIGLAVAGASFLSVIVLSTLRSRTSPEAPPASAVVQSPTANGLTVAMNGTTPPAEISLDAAVDSLSGALAYYREIADDHREGLVGCRVLDRAFTLVGRARARVDASRQQIAGHLPDADSIRVSMLGAEYTFVTQTYYRSGCRA